MYKTGVLIFIIVAMISNVYAQESSCNSFKTATYSGKGNADTKMLRESFDLFKEMVQTQNTDNFIDQAAGYFTIFGRPAQSLEAVLPQLPNGPICIQSIRVTKNNLSFVFFNFKDKPQEQMVLKMNSNFEYLSLTKVKFRVTGKVALKGDTVSIPIITIGNFSFIDGEINGVQGRWMFDTGNPHAISLHSKKVVNAKANVSGNGTGHVGSGETFKTLEYPLVEELKVGNIFFDSVPKVDANNMNYLENITSTVIGQVGFDFFKGYDIKIDYLRSRLTFYKQKKGVENWKDIKTKKNYITSIPYFTRKKDNVPMFKIDYKGIDVLVMLDTGGWKGIFILEDEKFNKLKKEGAIEDFYDEPSSSYSLENVKINKDLSLNLYGLAKYPPDNPFKKPLGITEKNMLVLGYSFFSEYITIWDTKNKIIYVLAKK